MINKLISYIVWRRECSMRKKIVAGNWKMNMTPKEAVSLVCELRDKFSNRDVDVVFCVPSIDIIPVVEAVKGTDIKVGAENMHYEEKGAYTGEISPGMLKEAGADESVLTLKSLEALANMANGNATKIIVPSNIQGIAGLATSLKEIMDEK